MEHWSMMLLHAVIISGILYLVMTYGFNQSPMKAQTRSVLIGAVAFIYMVLFGHGLPRRVNKDVF